MVKIKDTSRLQFSTLYNVDNVEFWGIRPIIEAEEKADDQFHTVVQDDRIDKLAHDYMGDSALWWIIADYNDLFFCHDLEIGSVLRIPQISTVRTEILT